MKEIIVEHVAGEKANQRDVFPLSQYASILIGRELDSQIQYSDASDQVSRRHAKIVMTSSHISVEDLGSRNGVFVNGRQISGVTPISHGNKVKLGNGGPEFVVRFNPEPVQVPKETRVLQAPAPTKEIKSISSDGDKSPVPHQKAKQPIGKETIERIIDERARSTGKSNNLKWILSTSVLVFVIGVLSWYFKSNTEKDRQELTDRFYNKAEEVVANSEKNEGWQKRIAQTYSNSVVYIEASWRLVETNSNQPVYHTHYPYKTEKGEVPVPVYISQNDVLEPLLSRDRGKYGKVIGGTHTGTGFVVDESGFVVTNRHVAASWMTNHEEFLACPCFVLTGEDKPKAFGSVNDDLLRSFKKWVPARSKLQGMRFSGQNSTLNVTFNNSLNRNAAQLTQVSESHDVAMIKINVPGKLKAVPLITSAQEMPTEGQDVLTMGYPGVSPQIYYQIDSADPFNSESSFSVKPGVSVTPGAVSRILSTTDGKSYSYMKDAYQLTINATGPGNSGGPVFDDTGRVFGLFFAGNQTVSYAVPIKYALEMMSAGM